MKHTEKMIQKACLDYLEYYAKTHDIYFFRAGSGAVKTQQGRYFKTGKKGCPDICGCVHGIFTGWEIKSAIGRQSADQKTAEKEIKKAGGNYFIIRSLKDLKACLK